MHEELLGILTDSAQGGTSKTMTCVHMQKIPLHQQPSRMLLLLIRGYEASARGRPRGPHMEEQTAARAGSQVLIQAH